MKRISVKIRNVGSNEDPIYEGEEDRTGKTMDGERRDVPGRTLSGWYPGVDDFVRSEHGVDADLEFKSPLKGNDGVTVFENADFEVTVDDDPVHRVQPTRWPIPEEVAEITPDEILAVVTTIVERGDRRWSTPSGAFLDLLRNLVAQGRIDVVADACRLYFVRHGAARPFIQARMSGLVINHYPPIKALYREHGFFPWLIEQKDLPNEIQKAAFGPGLRTAADRVVEAFHTQASAA